MMESIVIDRDTPQLAIGTSLVLLFLFVHYDYLANILYKIYLATHLVFDAVWEFFGGPEGGRFTQHTNNFGNSQPWDRFEDLSEDEEEDF